MTVLTLIERERARLVAALVGAGVAGGLAGASAIAAAGGWLLGDARWLTLPRALPWLLWGAIVGAAAAAAWWTHTRLRRDGAPGAVARAVEHERALRAGTVRGALEIADQGPLGALAASQVAERLGGTQPLAPVMQRRARGRAAGAMAAAVAAIVALVAVAVGAGDGLAALAHPIDAARGALLPAIRFADAPSALVRGEPLALRVVAPGRRALRVALRETGRPWRELTLPLDSSGAAPLALGPTDADVALVATDGRAHSDTLHVRVTDRAYLGDVTVRAEYPAYLARAAETLSPGEPLRVPRGTSLTIRGRASVALQSVSLSGAEFVALAARGHVFDGRFTPTTSGRYTWTAVGSAGPVAELPAALDVQLLADSAPAVVLASPAQDTLIDGLAALRARILASDDHGLTSVALRTWIERADGARQAPVTTTLAGATPAWAGEAGIQPAAMALKPGDKLHVQAVATDASPWRQVGTSREVILKVPSASELRALARASADSAVAGANALAAAQRELQRRTGEAARSRTSQTAGRAEGNQGDRQPQMGYQQAERAKGLAQEQRQLQDRTQQLQEAAKQLERQLAQAGALDTSLSRQMRDVQNLLRDALTPEMQKQLQQLEKSAGSLSPSDARQSLEQLAQQQRALREQLEKSAEMLKRAALEGAMQTLKDEARELAGEQQKQADRMERGAQQPGDAAKARELAERSRDLGKDIDQLGDRLSREKAKVGAERVAQAEQHADKSAEAMQRAAQAAQAAQRGADPQEGRRQDPERRDGSRAQPQESQQGGEQRQGGEQKQGSEQQRAGGTPQGAPQAGQQQGGQQQGAQQGGQQGEGQQGERGQQGAQRQAGAAREAANEMQAAAERLAAARQGQIESWKGELSQQLDRAIQETMQMAREQNALEREARAGKDANGMQGQQSAIQQGVEQAAQRLDQAGKSSSLLSQRAQRAMTEAKQQVGEATRAVQKGGQQPGGSQGGSGQQQGAAADAMKEASEALQRAAAALVRDRERVNAAASASGFEEMVEQLKQLAGQQGQINAQANAMPMPMPGQGGQGQRDAMRQLSRQQKDVAEKLEEIGDADATGRADALAREARQLAAALERAGADPSTLQRQQTLYRRLLEAGKTLERDERDDTGKREARSGAGVVGIAPADGATSGRAASKFPMPTWNELRALSADERRLVLEYFRRLNGTP